MSAERLKKILLSAARSAALGLSLSPLVACQQQMADQPRYEPFQKSEFFGDDRSARPLVEGTVARGQLRADEAFYTGKSGGKPLDAFPFPVTREVLLRGQ